MAIPFTDQQRHAIDFAGSVVLSAGAGSGKTRVLVHRYLHHLETLDVCNLVAITFTDRAAREMRSRIRAEIVKKRDSYPAGSAEAERWKTHEQNLESAVIDTIHGLGTRILRRFAAVLNLNPAFVVLDPLFTATVRETALETELQRILLDNGPLTDDLNELVVLFGWNAVYQSVAEMLFNPDPEAWQSFNSKPPAVIVDQWIQYSQSTLLADSARLLVARQAKLANLGRIVPATAEGLSVYTAVRQQLTQLQSSPRDVDVEALNELAKVGQHTKAKRMYGEDNYESVKEIYKTIREKVCGAMTDLKAIPESEHVQKAVRVGQRMARVALAVNTAYEAKKAEAAVLDFQDLLVLSRNLLRDHAFARNALQKQFRVLLLDELQDTDPVQMELASLLAGESKWNGGLFAVGDAKQSIYRFRGADVALFDKLRSDAPESSRQNLTVNFRSRPGILRFVNAVSSVWFPDEARLDAFREDVPEPCVECLWSLPPEGAGKETVDAIRHRDATAVAKRILELTAGPNPVCHRHEIVLLFRVMSDVAIYEAALMNQGIDYYLVGGRAFFAQQEVYDLFNLLSTLENPYDSLALVGVLRSPFCGLSDEAVHAVGVNAESIWDGLQDATRRQPLPADQVENIARAVRNLTAWRSVKDSLPIARLFQRVLHDSGYDAALMFEPLGERKLANLWKLQDIAREFDRLGASLAEFVTRLQDLIANQPREEQAATLPEAAANVVRIMSIHQAKGLEFPVVFVPDLSHPAGGGNHPAVRWHRELGAALPRVPGDYSKAEVETGEPYSRWPIEFADRVDDVAEASEGRRLFYVACTRAQERLILSSGIRKGVPIEPEGPWLLDLASIFDLTTGNCLIPDGGKIVVSLSEPIAAS